MRFTGRPDIILKSQSHSLRQCDGIGRLVQQRGRDGGSDDTAYASPEIDHHWFTIRLIFPLTHLLLAFRSIDDAVSILIESLTSLVKRSPHLVSHFIIALILQSYDFPSIECVASSAHEDGCSTTWRRRDLIFIRFAAKSIHETQCHTVARIFFFLYLYRSWQDSSLHWIVLTREAPNSGSTSR